jgi:hypothetical protein
MSGTEESSRNRGKFKESSRACRTRAGRGLTVESAADGTLSPTKRSGMMSLQDVTSKGMAKSVRWGDAPENARMKHAEYDHSQQLEVEPNPSSEPAATTVALSQFALSFAHLISLTCEFLTEGQQTVVGSEAEESSRFNNPDEPKTSPLDLLERPPAVWTGDLPASY